MLAVAFDTLKLARKLESAGFPAKQAQDASAALAESFAEWQSTMNLATREDVQKSKDELRLDIQKTREELHTDIQKVASNLRETELKLEAKIAETKADLIKWVVGMGFAQIALMLGLLKFHG